MTMAAAFPLKRKLETWEVEASRECQLCGEAFDSLKEHILEWHIPEVPNCWFCSCGFGATNFEEVAQHTIREKHPASKVYKTADKQAEMLQVVQQMQMALQKLGLAAPPTATASPKVRVLAKEELADEDDDIHVVPGLQLPCRKCRHPVTVVQDNGRLATNYNLREHIYSFEHDFVSSEDWLGCRKCAGAFRCASIWALQSHVRDAHGLSSSAHTSILTGAAAFDKAGEAEIRAEMEASFPLHRLRRAVELRRAQELRKTGKGDLLLECRRCFKAVRGRKPTPPHKINVAALRTHAWNHIKAEAEGSEDTAGLLWRETNVCFPEIMQEAETLPFNA